MRTAFIQALNDLASEDPRVCLVVGDLGYSVIEEFASKHPDQFVNAGVAEQNMVGLAAGLAMTGKVVFTYSIGNFGTLRCLEQIRNDVAYHRANVKVVAVGGGLAYGNLGVTHHASEDVAILRSLPNMVVVSPGDPVEAGLATRALVAYDGPAYLRLGKAGEPVVHADEPRFDLGKAITLRDGRDISLIASGSMLATANVVASNLVKKGLSVRLLSMHTIKPLDREAVIAAATQTKWVVTLEEHSVDGGLGGAVAEVLAEMESGHAPLKRIGLRPEFNKVVGDQKYLKSLHGLDEDGVMKTIEPLITRSYGLVS
ncbi:MAG TPA: transketolase C-terminal domain-containing protein [Candidatus Dormibacteraeota bacterium]|nr:transketolase C-terminal domain-containing protein [Candidatus Dormibacteraeota bacterium]